MAFISFTEADVIWINAVYIDKISRGRGIASKLINKAVDVAKKNGCIELLAYTDKRDLYLKNGWQLVSAVEENSVLKINIDS